VELFKALRNVYNASMKALEQEQQKWHNGRCKKKELPKGFRRKCSFAFMQFTYLLLCLLIYLSSCIQGRTQRS
jgi:hypothetical protein